MASNLVITKLPNMKKIKLPTLIIVCGLLIFIMMYFSCKKERIATNFRIENVQEILDEFNKGKLKSKHSQYYEGKVNIRASRQELLVFVETVEGSSFFFVLEVDKLEKSVDPIDIENAQVLYFKKSLIVNSLDKNERILFTVVDGVSFSRIPNISFTKNYKGFGLSKYGNFKTDISPNHIKETTTSIFDSEDIGLNFRASASCKCRLRHTSPDDSDCDAGGIGSTSCSLTVGSPCDACSCETECGTGYYACCYDE